MIKTKEAKTQLEYKGEYLKINLEKPGELNFDFEIP
jgi:hypothetical protein